jgi:uncharacterized protein
MCPKCKSRYFEVPAIRPVHLGRGLGIEEILQPHRDEIVRLAVKAGVEAIWVFGSVRRREASSASDVDFLVRWRRLPSLLDKADLILALEEELGRRVDVVTLGAIYWGLAPQIESEAVLL